MDENSLLYQLNIRLTFYSLLMVAIGAFTSITVSSISHILILLPCIFFTYLFLKENKKDVLNYFSLSQWCLLGLILLMIFSIIFFWLKYDDSLKHFFKFKYFLLPLLGVFAYREAFKNYIDLKKRKILLHLLLISTSVASLSGLIAMVYGLNPIKSHMQLFEGRNTGLFYIQPYAYGLSLFLIVLTGLIIHRDKIKEYINTPALITYWVINFLGLYFTYARGAWISYFLALPFFFFGKKHFIKALILCVLPIVLSIAFNPRAKERFLNSEVSNSGRIELFKAALYAFSEKPLLGWGFDKFQNNVPYLKEKYNLGHKDMVLKSHNNYLETLATYGIFGFLFLVVFHFSWAYEGFKSKTLIGDINFVFVISMVISGMVDTTWVMPEILFFIMLPYSLMLAFKNETKF